MVWLQWDPVTRDGPQRPHTQLSLTSGNFLCLFKFVFSPINKTYLQEFYENKIMYKRCQTSKSWKYNSVVSAVFIMAFVTGLSCQLDCEPFQGEGGGDECPSSPSTRPPPPPPPPRTAITKASICTRSQGVCTRHTVALTLLLTAEEHG